MSIQEALKLLRLELGLTQEDLAKKLNKTFLTVNRWENGKSFPSRSNAKNILQLAKNGNVSDSCLSYLNEVLIPETRRSLSAVAYGYPDIDRDFLFQLADGSQNALYVIEAESYKLLYVNQKAENEAACHNAETGFPIDGKRLGDQKDKRCFHYFGNVSEPCPFCPLSKISGSGYSDIVITIPDTGRKLMIHAKAAKIKDRSVYIIYLTDVTQDDAERSALYALTNEIPAGVGIYHVYLDDRIELAFMNRKMSEIIGEERARALMMNGPTNACLIHPEDDGPLKRELCAAFAEKRDASINIRMCVAETTYRMFQLDAKVIKKGKEKRTYYCVFKDLGVATA